MANCTRKGIDGHDQASVAMPASTRMGHLDVVEAAGWLAKSQFHDSRQANDTRKGIDVTQLPSKSAHKGLKNRARRSSLTPAALHTLARLTLLFKRRTPLFMHKVRYG